MEIYHAQRTRTPAFILHAEADPRVHMSQSIIPYRYLQLRGQAPPRKIDYRRD